MKKRSITPWAVVSGVAATGLLLAGCATVTDLGEREGRFVSYAAAGTGIGVEAELPLEAEAPGSPESPELSIAAGEESTAVEDAASEDPTTGDEKPDASSVGQGDGAGEAGDEPRTPAESDAAKVGSEDGTPGSTDADDEDGLSGPAPEQGPDGTEGDEPEGSDQGGSQPGSENLGSAASAADEPAAEDADELAAEAADPTITVSPAQVTQADLSNRDKGVKVTVTGLPPGTEIYDELTSEFYTTGDNGEVTFGVFYNGDTSKITGPISGSVTWGDPNEGNRIEYEFEVVVTPTQEPTTDAPTEEPTTGTPTDEPPTSTPTEEPTTGAPTSDPTTTAAPTTDAPTGTPSDTASPSATATGDAPSPSETGWTGAPADPTTTGAGSSGSPSTTTRSTDGSPTGASVHTGGESASPAPIVLGGGLIALGLAGLVVLYIRRRRL